MRTACAFASAAAAGLALHVTHGFVTPPLIHHHHHSIINSFSATSARHVSSLQQQQSLSYSNTANVLSMSMSAPEGRNQKEEQQQQDVMTSSSEPQGQPIWNKIHNGLLKNAAVLGVLGVLIASSFGMPDSALAARSGGRMGGRSSFSGGGGRSSSSMPSYRSSPPSSYRSGGGVSVLPVPVPVPSYGYGAFGYSPFGSPFGFGLGGYSSFGFGVNPVNLLVLGAVAYGASQVLSRGSSFSSYDEESYSSLGEGVSVIKFQIGLNCADRSRNGILGQIQEIAANADTSNMGGLSAAISEAALALVRKQSDWVAGATAYEHFRGSESGKAESKFNQLTIAERTKVEQETFSAVDGRAAVNQRGMAGGPMTGGPTQGVVTLVVALRGNSLRNFGLDRMVNSGSTLQQALSQLAGDALSDDGENVLAAELLWTPEEPWDTMDRSEMIADFPNLVDI